MVPAKVGDLVPIFRYILSLEVIELALLRELVDFYTSLNEKYIMGIWRGSCLDVGLNYFSDRINLYTSLITSASVGGWEIWQDIPAVWAIIIGSSQIINIAKPYIGKIRDFELYHELQLYYQEQNFELDNLWIKISSGMLTEDEIRIDYD